MPTDSQQVLRFISFQRASPPHTFQIGGFLHLHDCSAPTILDAIFSKHARRFSRRAVLSNLRQPYRPTARALTPTCARCSARWRDATRVGLRAARSATARPARAYSIRRWSPAIFPSTAVNRSSTALIRSPRRSKLPFMSDRKSSKLSTSSSASFSTVSIFFLCCVRFTIRRLVYHKTRTPHSINLPTTFQRHLDNRNFSHPDFRDFQDFPDCLGFQNCRYYQNSRGVC
jgi:hypothetical protein